MDECKVTSRGVHGTPLGETAYAAIGAGVLLVHATLLAWSAWTHSAVVGESGHLAAGMSHLMLGRFDLFRVNPPLVRTVAAVPLCVASASVDWSSYDQDPLQRSEHRVGHDWVMANGSASASLIATSRWMCIPFSVLGGFCCWCWSTRLYGRYAGLGALLMWCSSPYVLGHAALVIPDAHAAALGLVACFSFWLWLRNSTWSRALIGGTALGLAQLSKFTLLVLYPVWLSLWILYRLPDRHFGTCRVWARESGMLAMMFLLSLLIVNVGYEYEGSGQALGNYRFQSTMWTGLPLEDIPRTGGNRFADSWVGALPVPLPRNYVQGSDTQWYDFERGLESYLRGEWANRGWWYYCIYALFIKTPMGTWCLVGLAIGTTIWGRGFSASPRDETVVLAPFVAILVLVSSQSGFSHHSRYVIPALPFVFIWASKVARVFEMRLLTGGQRAVAAVVVVALVWSVASSLAVYPHSVSYFSEVAALFPTPANGSQWNHAGSGKEDCSVVSTIKRAMGGGPRNGHQHLLDSNIDWGQDLFYLKNWLDRHPEAKLDGLAVWGFYPASLAGIPETPYPPTGPDRRCVESGRSKITGRDGCAGDQLGPKPGWYALSVNYIHSPERQYRYRYFLNFEPVAMAGYSIYIYHITLDEANRVRQELRLPELTIAGREGDSLTAYAPIFASCSMWSR